MHINKDLLLRVKEAILANPEKYDQDHFCGTAFCIGGWAIRLLHPSWSLSEVTFSTMMREMGFDDEDFDERIIFWYLCNNSLAWPDVNNHLAMQAAVDAEDQLAYARAGAAHIDAFIAKYCEGE